MINLCCNIYIAYVLSQSHMHTLQKFEIFIEASLAPSSIPQDSPTKKPVQNPMSPIPKSENTQQVHKVIHQVQSQKASPQSKHKSQNQNPSPRSKKQSPKSSNRIKV